MNNALAEGFPGQGLGCTNARNANRANFRVSMLMLKLDPRSQEVDP